jgi:DNA polymerase-1
MTGDNADNIRGAEKIGPKTAAQLLGQFGTLENLLQNTASVKQPSIRQSLERNLPRLRTNYCLIRLNAINCLPFSPDEMVYRDAGMNTTQILTAIGLR